MDTPMAAAESVEKSLIGALVWDRDAIAAVSDRLTVDAFGTPRYRAIYGAVQRCWEQRIPPDPTTVHNAMRADPLYASEQDWWAGLSDIMDAMRWVNQTGWYTHAPYYADAVVAHARQRAMVDAGTRIVQMGHQADGGDPALAMHEAMAGLDRFGAVADRQGPRTYDEIIPDYQDRIMRMKSGEIPNRVTATGYRDLDRKLEGGFYPGELITLAARTGMGKALALTTPIPTPQGWTTMGDLRAGDDVFGRDGKPCRVTMKTPVQRDRECFVVRFGDGSEIVADADHRWLTSRCADRRAGRTTESVVTTREILQTLRAPGGRMNHAVRNTLAIDVPDVPLPIPPYTLGVWLGDGTTSAGRISKPDDEVFLGIQADGYAVSQTADPMTRTPLGLQVQLRRESLLGNKHIPKAYFRASKAQRLALLTGLMDTDGSISLKGVAEFSNTSESLAYGVVDLVLGMGWRCSIRQGRATLNGVDHGPKYIVRFTPLEQVFTIPRKARRFRPIHNPVSHTRYIIDVEPAASVPVACITVDSPDHTYLAGKAYIPTHNTALALNIAHRVARSGKHALVFSAEMSKESLLRRAASELSGVPAADTNLSDAEFDRFLEALERLRALPVSIDDTSGITTAQMMIRVQATQRQRMIGLVIFDYIELAGDKGESENEQQRITGIVRSLKHIARICDVPVLQLAQINRQVESRSNKRPSLQDLRASGSIEQESDKVLFIVRDAYYAGQGQDIEIKPDRKDLAEIIVAKHRQGATGIVELHFRADNMSFHDIDYQPDF